jgi:hypothetical protein
MHHSGTRRIKVGGCRQVVAGDSSHDWDRVPIPSNLKESKEEFENETLTVYNYGPAGGL